ncbi:MAG: hypothetical protein JXR77_17295 [Lentisphaeria bacterium]|nr:hypothetical protein [Lentisphaeria bacterium]
MSIAPEDSLQGTASRPIGVLPEKGAVSGDRLLPPPQRRSRRAGRSWLRLWRPCRFLLEFLCLRLAAVLASLLPRRVWLWLGARTGDVLYLLGVYRRTVRRNMDYVALWPPDERRGIVRRLYRNMGRYAAEMLRPPGETPPAVIEGRELLRRPADAGGGRLVLFAHMGNWELLPVILGDVPERLQVVAKPMRNPLVQKWLQGRRRGLGILPAQPRNALRHCLRAIGEHDIVAIAIDQYPGRRGTPSTFLGRQTRTVRTSAGLAARTGCPVVAVYALLEATGSYRVSIESVPGQAALPDRGPEWITAIQQAHNDVVSRWVVDHPEHWFGWFHRRFKDAIVY